MTQSLRRSQFITTYGPGAILEGQNGPRVILSLERSGIFANRQAHDFEITDQRLSQTLLNNAGIIRLPSNAELGIVDSRWIYNTDRFPKWSLCLNHDRYGILYRKRASDRRACPQCDPLHSSSAAWERANQQTIRFVRVCPQGHMDDVDWIGMIPHAAGRRCNPSHLLWEGGGGALRNVNIRCPVCHQSINLGLAYSRNWPCSGQFPELQSDTPGCAAHAKILQRGAANLHIAELVSTLTIPPHATALHRLLQRHSIRAALIGSGPYVQTKQGLIDLLNRLIDQGLIHDTAIDEVERYPDQTVLEAVAHTINSAAPANQTDLLQQEFEALRFAADNGSPPYASPTPGAPPQFEVIRNQVRIVQSPFASNLDLRVTPVNRLRVVMVQRGYRRLDPLNAVVDHPYYDNEDRRWYPGVELFGEGIYIDIPDPPDGRQTDHKLLLNGDHADRWLLAWIDPSEYDHDPLPEDQYRLHPVFVWWHTLAHRLINALSVDSGYSSASVRERVYVNITEVSGAARGGILLYTVQPGGDGTLGGLVALVSEFERVLAAAFRNIDSCSNDPLCGDEQFGRSRYNGAACYACALVSETSCEHRNMYLDRHLLLETL